MIAYLQFAVVDSSSLPFSTGRGRRGDGRWMRGRRLRPGGQIRSVYLLWLIGLFVVLGLIVWGLFAARANVLASLDTPEARAEWEAWKQRVRDEQQRPGAVQRRVPESPEPPTLRLMRDSFPAILAICCLIGAFAYGLLAFLVSGSLRQRKASQAATPASAPAEPSPPPSSPGV